MNKQNTLQVRKEFLLAKIRAGRTQMQDQYITSKKPAAGSHISSLGEYLPKLIALATRHPALLAGLAGAAVALLPRKRATKARARRHYEEAEFVPGRLTLALKALPYLIPLVSRVMEAIKSTKAPEARS